MFLGALCLICKRIILFCRRNHYDLPQRVIVRLAQDSKCQALKILNNIKCPINVSCYCLYHYYKEITDKVETFIAQIDPSPAKMRPDNTECEPENLIFSIFNSFFIFLSSIFSYKDSKVSN